MSLERWTLTLSHVGVQGWLYSKDLNLNTHSGILMSNVKARNFDHRYVVVTGLATRHIFSTTRWHTEDTEQSVTFARRFLRGSSNFPTAFGFGASLRQTNLGSLYIVLTPTRSRNTTPRTWEADLTSRGVKNSSQAFKDAYLLSFNIFCKRTMGPRYMHHTTEWSSLSWTKVVQVSGLLLVDFIGFNSRFLDGPFKLSAVETTTCSRS